MSAAPELIPSAFKMIAALAVVLGALFVAAGPDIQPGRVIGPVANVHVYPLLARLLGITPASSDGALDSIRAVLRRPL